MPISSLPSCLCASVSALRTLLQRHRASEFLASGTHSVCRRQHLMPISSLPSCLCASVSALRTLLQRHRASEFFGIGNSFFCRECSTLCRSAASLPSSLCASVSALRTLSQRHRATEFWHRELINLQRAAKLFTGYPVCGTQHLIWSDEAQKKNRQPTHARVVLTGDWEPQ